MTLPSVSDPPVPDAGKKTADHQLAEKHRPLLMFDANEPALPLVFGYTVLRRDGFSPSSKFRIMPPPAGAVIEYAIWYDWDIEHLYDLEHVWVHVDAIGTVIRVEGSIHGLRVSMDDGTGLPEMRFGRPVLYVEPGKHAIWAVARVMASVAGTMILDKCGPGAGSGGVHLGNRFAESGAYCVTPCDHRLACLAMKRAAFTPSYNFTLGSDEHRPALVPWTDLAVWIPKRVKALIAALPHEVPHLEAVFLDCGDTLIDEATEEKIDGTDIVVRAREIPFAMEAVRSLHAAGYRLALVADGPRQSFENLLKPRDIWPLMDAHVISGDLGETKPSPKMFAAAMDKLALSDAVRNRVVMVGNNLGRDIKGANDFGLISLFVGWSKRRPHVPADGSEEPDYRIDSLDALVPMIEAIELSLPQDEVRHG